MAGAARTKNARTVQRERPGKKGDRSKFEKTTIFTFSCAFPLRKCMDFFLVAFRGFRKQYRVVIFSANCR